METISNIIVVNLIISSLMKYILHVVYTRGSQNVCNR